MLIYRRTIHYRPLLLRTRGLSEEPLRNTPPNYVPHPTSPPPEGTHAHGLGPTYRIDFFLAAPSLRA